VKSSSSSSYIHVDTRPGTAPRANMGRMSGEPNEYVCEDWLKTESKST
jgi:hypothetical protein